MDVTRITGPKGAAGSQHVHPSTTPRVRCVSTLWRLRQQPRAYYVGGCRIQRPREGRSHDRPRRQHATDGSRVRRPVPQRSSHAAGRAVLPAMQLAAYRCAVQSRPCGRSGAAVLSDVRGIRRAMADRCSERSAGQAIWGSGRGLVGGQRFRGESQASRAGFGDAPYVSSDRDVAPCRSRPTTCLPY